MASQHPTCYIGPNSNASLLNDPTLAVLLTRNALRPEDCRHLNELEMDELFQNVMHSTLESSLSAYVAKEHNKALRWEFGA